MKKEGFEDGLLEYGAMVKRGRGYLIENTGKIIAAITAVVAVLVTFTDITFFGIGGVEFTSTLAVLLLSSYVIYFSLEDAGERLGEGSESFKAARDAYECVRLRIKPDMIPALRAFCTDYASSELKFRRSSLLCSLGYSEAEYEAYKGGAAFDKRARRAFRGADRLRAVSLSPTTLLTSVRQGGEELHNPEKTRLPRLALKLLPSTLCMVLTASVILTARTDLTPSVLADGILKLATLPIVGFRGYESGFAYATGPRCAWIETKTRLLECFLKQNES